MSEAFVINKELLFKNSVFEITSVSIEHNYDINGSNCEGEFIISGDYRLHEISINKEDFSFKIPFNNAIRSNVNLDSIEVEITDFSYELINNDELDVHVEYTVSGEQNIIEFADEQSLDEFLMGNDAEVIDLSDDAEVIDLSDDVEVEREELEKGEDILVNAEPEEVLKETNEESLVEEETAEVNGDRHIDNEALINSINSEEVFVKYHVHTVTEYDTLEAILTKYGITLVELKKYNAFETLELNMKLIIPKNEEN